MKIFIFFTISFLSHLLFAQNSEESIPWSTTRKLSWKDFKAPPPQNSNAAAQTATHLGFSYRVVNGKTIFTIVCRFEKNKSWVRVPTEWILKHEQGHFDITEIFARKLHRAVSEYTFNTSGFRKDLDSIYTRVIKEKEEFQLAYDRETDYSRKKTQQEEWLKRIEDELNRLTNWANY